MEPIKSRKCFNEFVLSVKKKVNPTKKIMIVYRMTRTCLQVVSGQVLVSREPLDQTIQLTVT